MKNFLIFIIKIYKFFISPLLGNKCRFLPTCSDYFIEALETQGFIKGFKLGITRIFKCHPFENLGGGHGIDFVPMTKNNNSQVRLKMIDEGLQKTSWKLEDKKESKNGQ